MGFNGLFCTLIGNSYRTKLLLRDFLYFSYFAKLFLWDEKLLRDVFSLRDFFVLKVQNCELTKVRKNPQG